MASATSGDRLVLADDPLVQDRVELEQLFLLALQEPCHWNAGPLAHDLGDLISRDLLLEHGGTVGGRLHFHELSLEFGNPPVADLGRPVQIVVALGRFQIAPGRFQLLANLLYLTDRALFLLPLMAHDVHPGAEIGQFAVQLLESFPAGLVLLLLQGGLLDLQLHQAAVHLVEFLRHAVHLGADHGTGLVDQVDGLVRQEPVGDIAVRENRGRDQCVVLDMNPVMHLEALAQTTQNGNRVFNRGLVDQ